MKIDVIAESDCRLVVLEDAKKISKPLGISLISQFIKWGTCFSKFPKQ